MVKRYLLLVVVTLANLFLANAQPDTLQLPKTDIVQYNHQFSAGPLVLFPVKHLYFRENYADLLNFGSNFFADRSYLSNIGMVAGVQVAYKALYADLQTQLPNIATNKAFNYTPFFSAKLAFTSHKHLYEGVFRYASGFAQSNQTSLSQPELQRGDISSAYFKGKSIFFIGNKGFSYRSLFRCSETQLKSAGTFMLAGELSWNKLFSDSAFVPDQNDNINQLLQSTDQLTAYSVGFASGYAYNWVLGHNWFAGAMLMLGVQGQYVWWHQLNTNANTQWALAPLADFRLAAGYNSDKYWGGITLMSEHSYIQTHELLSTVTYLSAKLSMGVRINAPKSRWLKYVPN